MATALRDLTGPIDFGRYSRDYASERPGPPAAFYDRLEALRPLGGARVRGDTRPRLDVPLRDRACRGHAACS